jgi:glycosyltransferase involved in cell wall biosynthesis
MISYNQENLISIALDSLLSQSVLPFEIIIGDDCSTDNTWNIINSYYDKYPKIIRPFQQKTNVGIYANLNSLLPLPKGEIVSLLAGDDFFKQGFFEAFDKVLLEKKLDPTNEKFIIITNEIILLPSGRERVFSNYCLCNKDLFKMKLRNDLIFRETGYSIKLFNELPLFREDVGLHADYLHSLEQIARADSFYFINDAFAVYRISQGIASKTKEEISAISRLKVIEEIKIRYISRLDKRDILFLKYKYYYFYFLSNKSFVRLLTMFPLLIINIGNFTPNKSTKNEIKQYVFVFIKYIFQKIHIYNFLKKIIKKPKSNDQI